jgi:hypothetical protein
MLRSKVCPTNPSLTRGRAHAELLGPPQPLLLLIVTFAPATAARPASRLPRAVQLDNQGYEIMENALICGNAF